MIYGGKPKKLGHFDIKCDEMLFYQYLPIKLIGGVEPIFEERLKPFSPLIGNCCGDFIGDFGLDRYVDSYVYLTVKKMYQNNQLAYNRKGYHSDGFMTDDINYIWCDLNPTVFNLGEFNLTLDDHISMEEMEEQAKSVNEFTYDINTLLRLDQSIIHKVSDKNVEQGMRTFFKISFSKDKYDLKGNAKNYLLDYDWKMRNRKIKRNIPQKL